MTKIDIKVSNIKSTNLRLTAIPSKLTDVMNRLSSLKSTIDRRIVQRTYEDVRLNNAVKSLQELERKIKNIHDFVDYSMDQYVLADSKASSFSVLGEKNYEY